MQAAGQPSTLLQLTSMVITILVAGVGGVRTPSSGVIPQALVDSQRPEAAHASALNELTAVVGHLDRDEQWTGGVPRSSKHTIRASETRV